MMRFTRRLPLAALALTLTATISLAHPTEVGAACANTSRAEVVVKVDLADGHTIDEVARAYPLTIERPLLASHGLYLVRATRPKYCGTADGAKKLAEQITHHVGVVYAEPNSQSEFTDGRFHAWPSGDPADAGTDPSVWEDQPAAQQLELDKAHAKSRGSGTVVAVLDTGVDPTHPALSGKLLPAWDYVDDDGDPRDSGDGVDNDGDARADESFGHGTFVSGLVSLVAPDARIMPMRVLDSEGRGNVFVVAEAITDSVNAGADVISLSFGTPQKLDTHLLEDAIKKARQRGVLVVAAAGNNHSDRAEYPAAQSDVLSVGALAENGAGFADFSNSGGWVDVAAPGVHVAGPMPGGRYAWWSGTSVSTPFVSGQLALVRAVSLTENANKVVDAVTHSTTKERSYAKARDARAINILRSLSSLH